MLRRVAAGACGLAITLGMRGTAGAQPHPGPCASVREHARDTVVVFEPPSTFTLCRGGAEQEDVVTGRPVYFQVTPTPGSSMFDFRVHGQGTAWTHTGLSVWEDQATRVTSGLRDLEHAAIPIADIPVPLDASAGANSPLRSLAAARSRYVADVTARYLEALHAVRGEARELPVIANVVRRWCGAIGSETPSSAPVEADLRARCAGPELKEGALDRDVEGFEAEATLFDRARDRARDTLLAALARPDDANAVTEAVKALDEARRAASTAVAAAHGLRESSRALARDVAELRIALRSIDAIRPGTPTYLSTYTAAGNAELEIDATPVDIAAAGPAAVHGDVGKTTARFPVVGRHYLDLEAGLGLSGGTPLIPYVENVSSVATIQGKPVDALVGLALVELEPARFLWPDRPLAGLVRFPVLALPFTRDPTQNFFAGGGLGWTGVGSIVVGPYLQYELTLRDGYSIGQPLPAGTAIQAATQQGLRVGSFVSASVDVLGLFHLFVPGHGSSIDAATGKEK
jgi:hypothetical protein